MAEMNSDSRDPEESLTTDANVQEDEQQPDSTDNQDAPIVTAKDLKAPATVLASAPPGDVGNLTVSLLESLSPGLSLEEVNAINAKEGVDARTPVMAVIEAVLAANGGKMTVTSLTEEVAKYWRKPFPTTPYSTDEFVFLVVRDSDRFIIYQ
jgi:hypothetical protein